VTGLTELRAELRADLAGAGLQVFDFVPTGFKPPAVLITPGDPYVEFGDLMSPISMRVHLEAVLVAGTGPNDQVITRLDSMLTTFILNTAEWHFDGASAPFSTIEGASNFLALRATVSRVFDLTEGN
jgi:hypothetical protein